MQPTVQASSNDLLEFGRRNLGPMLELLLAWVLLTHGMLRLLGRIQAEGLSRYLGGGAALAGGVLLLWSACAR